MTEEKTNMYMSQENQLLEIIKMAEFIVGALEKKPWLLALFGLWQLWT